MVKRRLSVPPPTPRKRQRTSSLVGHNTSDYNFLGSYHGRPVGSRPHPPPIKIMTSVLNKSAKRAAMVKKGRYKVKRGKKVKITKAFREKVKKANAGNVPYGEYRVAKVGYLGFMVPGTGAFTGVRTLPYAAQDGTNQYACIFPGTDIQTYARCVFQTLFSSGTGVAATIAGAEFCYFTPMKFLDAASKLWNQKTVSATSYATAIGNLSTVFDKTSGDPPSTMPAALGKEEALKIDVVNSYVTWEMKNVSQRPLKLVIHELAPKLKFVSETPLVQCWNYLQNFGDDTTEHRQIAVFQGNISAVNPQQFYYVIDPQCSLMKLDGLQWKGARKEIFIQPGETCVHNIKGPRGVTIDFGKLASGGSVEWDTIGVKGYTVNCMVEVMVDPQFTTAAIEPGYRPTFRTPTVGALVDPLQITVKEVMKLRCPQVVGFMGPNAFAANRNQQLNLRKKRIHIENWSAAQGLAAVTYSSYNEENPGAAIVSSGVM